MAHLGASCLRVRTRDPPCFCVEPVPLDGGSRRVLRELAVGEPRGGAGRSRPELRRALRPGVALPGPRRRVAFGLLRLRWRRRRGPDGAPCRRARGGVGGAPSPSQLSLPAAQRTRCGGGGGGGCTSASDCGIVAVAGSSVWGRHAHGWGVQTRYVRTLSAAELAPHVRSMNAYQVEYSRSPTPHLGTCRGSFSPGSATAERRGALMCSVLWAIVAPTCAFCAVIRRARRSKVAMRF